MRCATVQYFSITRGPKIGEDPETRINVLLCRDRAFSIQPYDHGAVQEDHVRVSLLAARRNIYGSMPETNRKLGTISFFF